MKIQVVHNRAHTYTHTHTQCTHAHRSGSKPSRSKRRSAAPGSSASRNSRHSSSTQSKMRRSTRRRRSRPTKHSVPGSPKPGNNPGKMPGKRARGRPDNFPRDGNIPGMCHPGDPSRGMLPRIIDSVDGTATAAPRAPRRVAMQRMTRQLRLPNAVQAS
jgi:hypothetical protein